MLRFVAIALFVASLSGLTAQPGAAQQLIDCPKSAPWLLPLEFEVSSNPATQQKNFYDFMWRSFIALNWPNVPIVIGVRNGAPYIKSGFRGEPDTKKSITVMSGAKTLPLAVWETYKEPFEVFPEPARFKDFAEWNQPRMRDADLAGGKSARGLLRYPATLAEYATDTLQPYFHPYTTGPLIDQNGHYVRYEVAVNQAFFTYVRHFRYYDANVQRQAVINWVGGIRDLNAFQRPPFGNKAELDGNGYLNKLPCFARQGMVDVKAAWKVLDTAKGDRPERYLHRRVIVDDKGTTLFMGLVALHILRYTPNGYDPGVSDGAFVAATFEQVDNVDTVFDPYAGLKPSFNSGRKPDRQQKKYGFEGSIPPKEIIPHPRPVAIYRVTPVPKAVQEVNATYQNRKDVAKSVFRYYRLIGTQNKHQGKISFDPGARATNGHEGPLTGVYTNTNNLINAALESYTQRNFSCILCHVRARPRCVPDQAFEIDHFKILTFLLQSAQPKNLSNCPTALHPRGEMGN